MLLRRSTRGSPIRFRRSFPGRLALADLALLGDVDVAERPGVLERSAGGLRPHGRCVVLVAVERRVGVDEVDAVAVQAPQDVEVVPRPHRAVREVRGARHGRRLPSRGRSSGGGPPSCGVTPWWRAVVAWLGVQLADQPSVSRGCQSTPGPASAVPRWMLRSSRTSSRISPICV